MPDISHDLGQVVLQSGCGQTEAISERLALGPCASVHLHAPPPCCSMRARLSTKWPAAEQVRSSHRLLCAHPHVDGVRRDYSGAA